MTVVLTQARPKRKRIPGAGAIFAARLVLFWEKFWPAILPALALPAAYLFISLCSLWRFIPAWLHAGVLIAGALAFAALLYRDLRSLRFPSRRAGQARLEEDGRVDHAALQALDDAPFTADESASPLWRAHLDAMAERARAARLSGVRATAEARDPWGLRFIALGLLAIALVAGGKDSLTRLALGLQPGAAGPLGGPVADLWIEPPAYAGRAPIYLLRAGESVAADNRQIDAPEGSIVVAQINGGGRARLTYQAPADIARADFARNGAARRAELAIVGSGLLRLNWGAREGRWPIGVIADEAPDVFFTAPPAASDDGRLSIAIAIADDYGVTGAELILRLDPAQERPLDAPPLEAAPLAERRTVPLDGVRGQRGERAALLDLQADPWAGLGVLAQVTVHDGAGQSDATEEFSVVLPAKTFFNPSAKAVIEQRQTLAVASDDWRRAARSFDAMTLAPDVFYAEKPTDYLLLRAAFWRVMRRNGDDYQEAVAKFWPLALQLEDEALELARQRLDAAREALRQALENGASEEEIARLVEELRQAMNDYLAALAESGQAQAEDPPRNAQQLERSDLDDMLDAIRNLSEQGADNAARQMLSDLENMLNNLRLSQGSSGQGQQGQGESGGEGAGGAAGEAGDLIGRQRELADEAFARGQAGDGNGDDLAGREGALGGDLDELLDELSREAPDSDAMRALGRARNAMREAESALSGDDFGAASDAMERAIGALREGAGDLAEEQRRQASENGESGDGERSAGAVDPLGRPAGNASGDGVDVPGESDAGKSRAIIDELRRRLGEPDRADDETDYLERLLERF